MTTAQEGWLMWAGGDCPVVDSAEVDIRLSNGRVVAQTPAGRWTWNRPRNEIAGLMTQPSPMKSAGVIVAYRKVGEVA